MVWVVNRLVMESCGRRRHWWVVILVRSLRHSRVVWMVCVLGWGRWDWRPAGSSFGGIELSI